MAPHASGPTPAPLVAVARTATDDGELAAWAASVVAATERAADGRCGEPHAPRGAARPGGLTLFELARGDSMGRADRSARGERRSPRDSGRVARLASRRASAPAEPSARPPTPAPPRSWAVTPPPTIRIFPRAPSLPVAAPRARTLSSEPPPSPSAAAAAALYATEGGTPPAAALVAAKLAPAAVVSPFALCARRPAPECGSTPRVAFHHKLSGPPCLARKSGSGLAGPPSLSRRSSSGGGSGGAPPCLSRRSGPGSVAAAAPWHAARAPWAARRPGALTMALARLRGRDRTHSAGL